MIVTQLTISVNAEVVFKLTHLRAIPWCQCWQIGLESKESSAYLRCLL